VATSEKVVEKKRKRKEESAEEVDLRMLTYADVC
jgi:hypothetical protein